MARNANVTCPTGQWTQLTDTDVTGDVTVALISGGPVLLNVTTGATEPSSAEGAPLIFYGDGWSEATIAEKFPGVASGDRLWARPDRSDSASAVVFISYA